MAYVIPNSTVILLKNISLTPTYENTVDYENADAQYADMFAHRLAEWDRCTYVGKNKQQGTIRLESTQGLLMQQATYMMFKNTSYENKWFYAFVTDVTWVNNVTWEVSFILDVMQTYYFDFTYSQCLIERQHVEDDSIGANLIEENLEIGEYVVEGATNITEFQKTHTCVATTLSQDGYEWNQEHQEDQNPTSVIDGVNYGCKIYKFLQKDKFGRFIRNANEGGVTDQIIDIYEVPDFATGDEVSQTGSLEISVTHSIVKSIDKPYENFANKYVPKNNKLYTYPFKYLKATNHTGNIANYRYENFMFDHCDFDVHCTITPNPEGYVAPTNYLHFSTNIDEGLSINDFPKGGYVSDQYKAWLAQTANSRTLQMLGIGASAVVGVAGLMTGAGGMMMASATSMTTTQATAFGVGATGLASSFKQASNMYAQKKDRMVNSQQATGNKSNSVVHEMGYHHISLYRMCIKPYFAKRIDDYFTKYGYAINELALPNPKARPHFTFIKTVGCDVKESLPSSLVEQINSIHDNGITFWKNLDSIGDYSLDNRPV